HEFPRRHCDYGSSWRPTVVPESSRVRWDVHAIAGCQLHAIKVEDEIGATEVQQEQLGAVRLPIGDRSARVRSEKRDLVRLEVASAYVEDQHFVGAAEPAVSRGEIAAIRRPANLTPVRGRSETPRVAGARIEQAEFVVDAYKREQVLLRRWNDLSKTRCDLGLVVIPDLMERTPTVVGVRSHFEHVAAQRRTRGNRIAANRAI